MDPRIRILGSRSVPKCHGFPTLHYSVFKYSTLPICIYTRNALPLLEPKLNYHTFFFLTGLQYLQFFQKSIHKYYKWIQHSRAMPRIRTLKVSTAKQTPSLFCHIHSQQLPDVMCQTSVLHSRGFTRWVKRVLDSGFAATWNLCSFWTCTLNLFEDTWYLNWIRYLQRREQCHRIISAL
jgi:hypothetical protein